jgi:hypothetical protein
MASSPPTRSISTAPRRRLTATKLLAAGGIVVLALLALLWRELQATSAVPPPPNPKAAVAQRAAAADVAFKHAVERVAQLNAEAGPGKVDVRSDEFYFRFDQAVPRAVSRNAMRTCYANRGLSRQDRDAYINLEFVDHIKNGEVTISEVRVKESTLTDKALEACMVREVAKTHFHDDSLPDYKMDDSVVMTPERIVHKYVDDGDDGAEAPANTPR